MSFLSAFHSRSLNGKDLTLAYSSEPSNQFTTVYWNVGSSRPAGQLSGAATNGTYLICGCSGTTNTIFSLNTSGVWSSITLPSPTTATAAVGPVYYNGLFIVIGSNGLCVWTSSDGVTWAVTNYTSGTLFGQSTYTVAVSTPFYCNGAWQVSAVGGSSGAYTHGLLTSSNGTTWSVAAAMTNVTNANDSSAGAKWAVNTAGTAAMSPSNQNGDYYYTTAVNTASQKATTNPWGNSNSSTCVWIAEQSAFAVVGAGATSIGYLASANFSSGTGTTVTIPVTGGGSLAVLKVTGKTSVVISPAWSNGQTTHAISYDGGFTWTTTQIASSVYGSDNFLAIAFNNQIYLIASAYTDVYIGTPS